MTGLPYDTIPRIDDDIITRAMSGKASPLEFSHVLRVASLMISDGTHKDALLGCGDIVTFVDWFFGMDCNGFAGNYVKEVTGSAVNYQSHSCKSLSEGTKRTSVSEIQPQDFIYHNSDPQHIAIIGTIISVTGKSVECNVSEARSFDFGGVQTKEWKIRKADSGWAMNRGGLDRMVTSISRSSLLP